MVLVCEKTKQNMKIENRFHRRLRLPTFPITSILSAFLVVVAVFFLFLYPLVRRCYVISTSMVETLGGLCTNDLTDYVNTIARVLCRITNFLFHRVFCSLFSCFFSSRSPSLLLFLSSSPYLPVPHTHTHIHKPKRSTLKRFAKVKAELSCVYSFLSADTKSWQNVLQTPNTHTKYPFIIRSNITAVS